MYLKCKTWSSVPLQMVLLLDLSSQKYICTARYKFVCKNIYVSVMLFEKKFKIKI